MRLYSSKTESPIVQELGIVRNLKGVLIGGGAEPHHEAPDRVAIGRKECGCTWKGPPRWMLRISSRLGRCHGPREHDLLEKVVPLP